MSASTPSTTPGPNASTAAQPSGADAAIAERVAKVLSLIRPAIQSDGGDIEFVAITPERKVQIRLHGACVGCPSSLVTLKTGIERNLLNHVPQITGVEAVE